MKYQKNRPLKYSVIVGLLIIVPALWAGDIDLTTVTPGNVRPALTTIFSKLSTGLEAPAIVFSQPGKSSVIFWTQYNAPDLANGAKRFQGLPAVGLALGLSPTIIVAGQLSAGRWQEESLNAIGLFLGYCWGESAKPNQVICGLNHIKGPRDFHFRDLSLGYLKLFRKGEWNLSLAGTAHLTQAWIHVTDNADPDDNYKTSMKIDLGLLRFDLSRNVGSHLKIGGGLAFTQRSVSGIISFMGYI